MANKLYEEKSVQAIADALRLKKDASGDTYRIGEMAEGVLTFPFANIPAYHSAEAGRVVKRLLDLKAAHPHHLLFGAIADNHVDRSAPSAMASARHAAFALEAVGAMAGCDFVANLGDNVVDANVDDPAGYSNALYMDGASRYAITAQTAFNLIGNHEKSASTQRLYDLVGRYNAFDDHGLTPIRGYGYKDFADKKVRVIALNTTDYWNVSGGNGMSYEQKDFLMRALDLSQKADPAKWLVLILSHIPLDFLGGDYNKGGDLKAILQAYASGTAVAIPVNSAYAAAEHESPASYPTYAGGFLTYDYAGRNFARVVNVHGHVHTNAYGKLVFIDDHAELDMMRISTPNSAYSQNKTASYAENGSYGITAQEAARIAKAPDSARDTSATFYFIDLDEQIVYAIGYGADVDRTIPYKDADMCFISYALTGAVSSNTAAAIVRGEPYATAITAQSGYELQSVTVEMGGVDITASVCTGGMIAIPEVTGNVVITAYARDNYIPVWDIAERRAVTDVYEDADKPHATLTSRRNYICGVTSTGVIDYRKVSNVLLDGNDVTFTASQPNYNIGLPYQLEPGATYTFAAKASQAARLRVAVFDQNGFFVGEETYSSSGTELSHTFTATAHAGYWTVLMLDVRTAGNTTKFSGITLTRVS